MNSLPYIQYHLFKPAKNFVFFFLYFLLNPQLWILFAKGYYIPVHVQFQWLKKFGLDVFIDVGASKGNVSQTINYLFPKAKIYAFEPIEKELEILKSKIKGKSLILEKLALTDKVGQAQFYIFSYTPVSSLLKMVNQFEDKFNHSSTEEKIIVKTSTLDKYFANKNLKGCVVLKIDTQGTEYLILKKGVETLKKISIIIIESSFSKMYHNQYLFSDIYKLLTNQGFVYAGKIDESQFYPTHELSISENSVFIKISFLNSLNE